MSLAQEYNVWHFVTRRLADRVKQRATKLRPKADMTLTPQARANRVICLWLLGLRIEGDYSGTRRHPLLPTSEQLSGSSSSSCSADCLVELLHEKYDIEDDAARQLAADVVASVREFVRSGIDDAAEGDETAVEIDGAVTVGDFRSVRCERVRCLVRAFGLEATAQMLLRCDVLEGHTGNESGITVSAFNALRRIGGVRYEGFASPLNSKMLGVPDCRFCSLFADDTDAPFASLGDFFSVELSDFPGGWAVNPPWIPSYMQAVAEKILSCVRSGADCWFFVYFPQWRQEDDTFYHLLNDSQFKLDRIDFVKRRGLQQNACGNKVWSPNIARSLFVIGREDQLPAERLRNLQRVLLLGCSDAALVHSDWAAACRSVEGNAA